MRKNRAKLLIYLIDRAHTYEYGVKNELEASEAKVVVFRTFDDCSRELHKNPDVVVMDDEPDPFVKSRIKSRLDQLPFSVKMIFIASKGSREEDIKANVVHDDYVVKDSALFEKLHLAIDEYAFTSSYKEEFHGESLTVGNSRFKLHDLLLPASIIAAASTLFILSL